ncbi:hypothetical protein [Novosphingobium sp. FSW06-99]|uniref:hypothetical protein n=1 Tax=Novosphingobium sp. FSW06-99 TaxID=1739113 RepID=UPI00076D615F|nr:hypothetical protein [Novosphingobium sp. FSW06-99]KUR74645.1 hypothetical protein AQZ49_17235 [Novosphingobium sp. FSW06-99]
MTKLLIGLLGAAALVAGVPAQAQMHEGNRGGGSHAPGGGAPRGAPGGGAPRGVPGGGAERGGAPRGAPGAGAERGAPGGFRDPARPSGPDAARGMAHGPEFHGRAFGSLSADERAHWAGGEWRHVMHGGVYGWWWFLDDDWYFYPDAIYPYPTYIAPLLSVQETPEPPPQTPYWYYCANPVGYYPYVPACPIGWQTVPAVPDDAPPGAPPPPPPPGPPAPDQ